MCDCSFLHVEWSNKNWKNGTTNNKNCISSISRELKNILEYLEDLGFVNSRLTVALLSICLTRHQTSTEKDYNTNNKNWTSSRPQKNIRVHTACWICKCLIELFRMSSIEKNCTTNNKNYSSSIDRKLKKILEYLKNLEFANVRLIFLTSQEVEQALKQIVLKI